jgi:hypothetical protein
MKGLSLGRAALCSCVAVALLAGCGGSQQPIGAPGWMPQSRAIATHAERGGSWMLPEAKSEDLLYADGLNGVATIFAYPGGKRVGTLQDLYVEGGICSNNKGDVFFPTWTGGSESTIYEFAHGGTTPITTLNDPAGMATSCSYDSTTGNLGVANGGPTVAIFQNSQGAATVYQTGDVPAYFCAYDNAGDLFIDDGLSSDMLAELQVGSSSFADISLRQPFDPLSLQWDKNQLVVVAGTNSPKGPQPVYSVKISGSMGYVSGPIMLSTKHDKHVEIPVQYSIRGKTFMGPGSHSGLNLVDFWEYPTGGNTIKTIKDFGSAVTGETVSAVPK